MSSESLNRCEAARLYASARACTPAHDRLTPCLSDVRNLPFDEVLPLRPYIDIQHVLPVVQVAVHIMWRARGKFATTLLGHAMAPIML